MTAAEVIQALSRAPFDTVVFVRLPSAGVRFNIERIELATEGQEKWEIEVAADMHTSEP
jgi:hypothetical protein